MFPVEADGLLVVFVEQVEGVHGGVLVAKEAEDTLLFFIVHTVEAELGDLFIGLYQRLGHHEVLLAVSPWVREVLCPDHTVLLHRLAHLQGRVDEDAVVAVEHLGIHPSHRGADDEVWVLPFARLFQQRQGLLWLYGQVGGNDLCLWQHLTDACHRTTLA